MPMAPPVLIEIASEEPETWFELRTTSDVPIFRCQGACAAYVPAGTYAVYVEETDDTRAGQRKLTLEKASSVTLTPRSKSTGSAGLALGIAGSVALPVGLLMVISATLSSCEEGLSGTCNDSQTQTIGLLGLALFLGGAVATPIGWVMFAKSRRPGVEVEPLAPAQHGKSSRRLPVQLGLMTGDRQIGVRAGFAF